MHGLGLDELIAKDVAEYERLAIDFATHPGKLGELKERLRRNRDTHPLFNVPRYVRNLESAYLEMWRIHESGDAPRSFSVEDAAPFATPREIR